MCFGENEGHASYFRAQQERIVHAFTVPIEAAMGAGTIRTMDVHATAHIILGNIQGLQVHLLLAGDTACSPLAPESAAGFLTHLLMDGLSV